MMWIQLIYSSAREVWQIDEMQALYSDVWTFLGIVLIGISWVLEDCPALKITGVRIASCPWAFQA